jgi:serine/threonine protein kinase
MEAWLRPPGRLSLYDGQSCSGHLAPCAAPFTPWGPWGVWWQHEEMCAAHPAGALGSPGFVSPEVVHDAPHEPSMDIFSLGVVLFVMLVGRKPFSFQVSSNFVPSLGFATSVQHMQKVLHARRAAAHAMLQGRRVVGYISYSLVA